MKRLAILGASGHGKVVGDAAALSGWEIIAFFDDEWPRVAAVGPWAMLGGTSELLRASGQYEGVVVAIGNNAVRLQRQRELAKHQLPFVSIVHPAATVSRLARVGPGSVIFAGAVLNPFAEIGAACIINTCASVDHDCLLADGVHVSPGAHLGGGVQIGEGSWVGIGAAVKHGLRLGNGVTVGASYEMWATD